MRSKGFTLIELLVVISIISMLSSVVLASMSNARDRAKIAAGQKFDSSLYRTLGDRIIGDWNFNECGNAGNVVNDSSLSNSDGTTVNDPSWPTDTPSGSGCAIDLNGSSQYILGGTLPNLPDDSKVTISAWINPDAVTGNVYRVVFSKGLSGNCYNYRMIVRSGTLWAGNRQSNYDLGGSVKAGAWQHVAIVYNASGATGYINGVRTGSNSSAKVIACDVLTWVLGRRDHVNASDPYDGKIDEVKIYLTDLTASEINRIYAEEAKERGLAIE